VPKCLGAELSAHFGTSAELSSGHFGTGAEVSWYRSVLGLKCPVTLVPHCLKLSHFLMRVLRNNGQMGNAMYSVTSDIERLQNIYLLMQGDKPRQR